MTHLLSPVAVDGGLWLSTATARALVDKGGVLRTDRMVWSGIRRIVAMTDVAEWRFPTKSREITIAKVGNGIKE